MNSSYRVLKLRSGEEIVTQIKGKDGNKLILNNPMMFKTTTQMNQFGQTQEVTFLTDWLSNSSVKMTKIPENFVLTWLTPSKDVLRLYDIELKSKKINGYNKNPVPPFPPNSPHNPNSLFNKAMLDNLLSELERDISPLKDNSKFVFMHMMLPPDLVEELMEEGILNFEGMEDNGGSIESINEDLYTGDQKNDPDYGNRWTDWNPNPTDDEYH